MHRAPATRKTAASAADRTGWPPVQRRPSSPRSWSVAAAPSRTRSAYTATAAPTMMSTTQRLTPSPGYSH